MRIVFLLRSATEVVCTLGLTACLVGVLHEYDYLTNVVTALPYTTPWAGGV